MPTSAHKTTREFSALSARRVWSSEADFATLFAAAPSPANGLTLCRGSLGAGAHNDVAAIARRFAERAHFVHLCSVRRHRLDPGLTRAGTGQAMESCRVPTIHYTGKIR